MSNQILPRTTIYWNEELRIGDRRTGNRRTGNRRTGNRRTGNRRTGNRRTGNRRTGNHRIGGIEEPLISGIELTTFSVFFSSPGIGSVRIYTIGVPFGWSDLESIDVEPLSI